MTDLRHELEHVLVLQRQYSRKNTPEMKERWRVINYTLPELLREELVPSPSWLLVEGGDGTGLKAKVPWVRIYSAAASPDPQEGFYVVFLMHEDGLGVSLSLNQGTTEGDSFSTLKRDLLRSRVAWAREHLSAVPRTDRLVDSISIGTGRLAKSYMLGHVQGFEYKSPLPSTESIIKDVQQLVDRLAILYDRALATGIPGAADPVVVALTAAVEEAAGKSRTIGAPRGLNAVERKTVETHAMFMATELLQAQGWTVEDKHKTESYDLFARRGSTEMFVEVKGTTGSGEAVILTRNEVDLHRRNRGSTCLVLVRNILLSSDDGVPTCTGGQREMWYPWQLEDSDLSVLAYEYRVKGGTGLRDSVGALTRSSSG